MSRTTGRSGELVLTLQVRERASGRFFWQCRAADQELLSESPREFKSLEECFVDACRMSARDQTLSVEAEPVR